MQPLVIREPICQVKHLSLKLWVGNHPFYESAFVWDALQSIQLRAAAPRLTSDLAWRCKRKLPWVRLCAASHSHHLSVCILCHCCWRSAFQRLCVCWELESEWAAVAIFPIFTLLRWVQLLGPLRSNQTSGDGRKILPLSHKVLFEKEYLLFIGFAAISFESICF